MNEKRGTLDQSILLMKSNMITVAARTRYTLEELQEMLEKYSTDGKFMIRVPLPGSNYPVTPL